MSLRDLAAAIILHSEQHSYMHTSTWVNMHGVIQLYEYYIHVLVY